MTEPVDFQEQVAIEEENSEKGASMVEYALLVALIALIAIAAVRFLGNAVSQQFSTIGNALSPG